MNHRRPPAPSAPQGERSLGPMEASQHCCGPAHSLWQAVRALGAADLSHIHLMG